jgi:2-dehydropantoate 2-reductase
MRVAIFGAGGAGGLFGARLARAGVDVVFVARGAHLEAMRSRGLRVETPQGEIRIDPVQASDDASALAPADFVLVGVKAGQVSDAARAMGPLIGPETLVVPLQNGVEAAAQLAAGVGAAHVVGGLCGTFSWVTEPGRIRSIGNTHFVRFARLDGRRDERLERLRAACEGAGIRADIPDDIQAALWEKFSFIASFGGVGAVARAPIGVLRSQPETRQLLERGVGEIDAVARAHGVALPIDHVASSMAFIDSLDAQGTSSLQRDIADARPSELDALSGAVVRLGTARGVDTPLHAYLYASLLPQEQHARRAAGSPAARNPRTK